MWFLVLLACITGSEQVDQDKSRVILKNSENPSDPCEGHVQIYHKNTWGYVGDDGRDRSTEEVVCRSTHCGQPLEQLPEYIDIPTGSKVWLNEMACNGTEEHLSKCWSPGWDISKYQKHFVRKIKCSDRINITLDGFRCAGAVQYSINENTKGYFCSENWGRAEANRVCESLGCGKFKGFPQQDWMVFKGFKSAKKATIDCSGIEKDIDHLWQCVSQTPATCTKPAFVVCEGHEKLRLNRNTSNVCSGTLEREANGKWERNEIKTSPDVWCQQMNCGTKRNHSQTASGTEVTCSDTVKVQLVNDASQPSKCFGRVSISINDTDHSVCANNWNTQAGEVVCRELNCGKAIGADSRPSYNPGIMDNVNCLGNESSLWDCQAKHEKLSQCSSSAYVVCKKSLGVRLKDGPGRCAGRVEIRYEGQWRAVSAKGWTDNNSNSVCRQLRCGGKRDGAQAGGFSQGSGGFFPWKVECETGTSHISDCVKGSNQNQRDGEAVGLTCEDHMVVFLEGNTSCSGLVGIEHGSKTYWLSGSNTTWNRATAELVCQQMQCGSLLNDPDVISNSDMHRDVWNKFVNCSAQHESLLDCKENEAAPDHNETIAYVRCSGDITLQLSNKCYGHVNVSMGDQWGGVCADAWTDAKSVMLCEDLGCGDKILTTPNPKPAGFPVIVKSLHETQHSTKLSQCNFVKNNENAGACKKGAAYVVCAGSGQFRLTDTRDSCSGNVEVFYAGQWSPTCANGLFDPNGPNIVCQELNCGQAEKTIPYVGRKPVNSPMSELICPADSKACSVKFASPNCPLTGLRCSKWSTTALRDTCSGDVMLHTHDGSRLDPRSWNETMGRSLCQSLNCGDMKPPQTSKQANESVPALRTSAIECQEKPSVTLSGDCRGTVRIDGVELCSTTWTEDYSHKVCHQLDCSNAVAGVAHVTPPRPNAEYYHVTCDSFHHELGQCKRHKDKCGGKLVTVSCVESVEFKTTEHCGGRLQVNYQDEKWEHVCPLDKTVGNLMNMLCQAIKCGNYNESIRGTSDQSKEVLKPLNAMINYTEDYRSIRHAVRVHGCGRVAPARIFCNGYKPPDVVKAGPPISIVSIMLGVGVLLILVILGAIFVRIWFIKKRRNTMKHPTRMLSQHEMEFESGEFEQIKEGEMESFTHNRFRPESEVIMENNRLSASSLPYDDVDEVAQPLTAAASSGGDHLHEEAGKLHLHVVPTHKYKQQPERRLSQHTPICLPTDGPTYEVEDPHDSYDDIDAGPDVTQTKAEVHDGSSDGSRPEPAASHRLQQDDYLVPGQDG